jgi:hypothetical protein
MAKFSDIRLEDRLTFYVTCGIFSVAVVTAIILIKQANVMEGQLEEMKAAGGQTERLVILNTSQMANAAKTAEATQIQAQAAQDSVKAIRRQMQQDQRAWLSIRPNWPPAKNPSGETVANVVQLTPNAPLSVPMRMTISGKTAAKQVLAIFFVEVVKATDAPKLDSKSPYFWRFSAGLIQPTETPGDFLVYRQQPGIGLNAMSNLGEPEMQELRNGDAYLVVHGKMRYRDIFEASHWAKYCFAMPLSFTLKYYNSKRCSDYNSIDNR